VGTAHVQRHGTARRAGGAESLKGTGGDKQGWQRKTLQGRLQRPSVAGLPSDSSAPKVQTFGLSTSQERCLRLLLMHIQLLLMHLRLLLTGNGNR
jgi:hypothetical protein